MKHLIVMTTAVAVCMVGSVASAQDVPTPPGSVILNDWVGDWTATGTMLGMDATASLSWEWALGGWYLLGNETLTLTTPGGPMEISVMLMMAPNGDGTYGGYYLDDTGEHHPMTSTETGDGGIVIGWTDSQGTQQMTISQDAEGVITGAIQLQAEDGSWADSGMLTYTQNATE